MNDIKKTKKSPTKHIADVQKPGTSAPSETSRPVIVTNRPLLRDPMVVAKKDNEADEKLSQKPTEPLSSSGKPDLQPLTDSITPDEESTEPDVEKSVVPPTEEGSLVPEAPATAHQPEEAKTLSAADSTPEDSIARTPVADETDIDSESSPATSPEAAPASADDQTVEGSSKNAAAKKAEAEAAEQAKHDTVLRTLVDSKQYVLPINTVEKRQTKRFVLLGIGLSVLLALIWLDIALDAGIFKLGGLNPVTHFFSN